MGCLFATGGFPVYILGPLFRWVICLFIITLLSSLSPCELTLFLNQCCIFFLLGAGVGNLFPVASLWRMSQLMSPRVLTWGACVCVTRKGLYHSHWDSMSTCGLCARDWDLSETCRHPTVSAWSLVWAVVHHSCSSGSSFWPVLAPSPLDFRNWLLMGCRKILVGC